MVAIAGALIFLFKNFSLAPTAGRTAENGEVAELEKIKIDPEVPGMTLPLSNDPKDVAWELFQKYLSYNKSKNLEGVRSIVYRVAPVCEDSQTRIECEGRMGAAYAYGSTLRKADFVNAWTDERQTILSTDFKIEADDSAIARNRAIIFFLRDASGDLKLLSFSPVKGAVASRGPASEEELTDRIIIYTEDKDEDGISDYEEECIGAPEDQNCVKTSPKLRDTDGDGLWDGIEVLINGTK